MIKCSKRFRKKFGAKCPNCGEGYMTAQTLQVIERIKKLRQTVASKRPVSAAVFK